MPLTKAVLVSLWALAFCLPAVNPARAHKLLVSAVADGENNLTGRAFFPDGSPAQEIPVTVTPGDGPQPMTGVTDRQGVARFPGLKPGKYRVSAGDPLGHRGETSLVIPGAASPAAPPVSGPKPATVTNAASSPPSSPPSGEPLPWGNILAGLGFIFGLASFVMVLKLRADLRRHASRN